MEFSLALYNFANKCMYKYISTLMPILTNNTFEYQHYEKVPFDGSCSSGYVGNSVYKG